MYILFTSKYLSDIFGSICSEKDISKYFPKRWLQSLGNSILTSNKNVNKSKTSVYKTSFDDLPLSTYSISFAFLKSAANLRFIASTSNYYYFPCTTEHKDLKKMLYSL